MNYISLRQKNLLSQLSSKRLDGLLVTSPANIAYLTGFRGSAGVALFAGSQTILWVDPRYTAQARAETRSASVREVRSGLLQAASRWALARRFRRIGYDAQNLTCRSLEILRKAGVRQTRWVSATGLVESLRATKDPGEVDLIRRACRLTAGVFEEVLKQVKPGLSELELAAELEYRMKRKGAEGPAFGTIVASGAGAALPHARPSAKLLEKGDLVIFDLGAILHGYSADMTRTVFLGHPPARVRRLYEAVRDAQQRGLDAVQAGATAGQIDGAVRAQLRSRGLGRLFTHSTGHGVGLEIHEAPRLARGEMTRLKAGAVVTVEPGIYIEGFGGIRIEDTVVVGPGSAEILTPVPKDRWILD